MLQVLPLGHISRLVWPRLFFPFELRRTSDRKPGDFLGNPARGKWLKQCSNIVYFNSSELNQQLPVQINEIL